MKNQRTGEAAIVTGASRGVGRGVAIALDAAGYKVFATGRSILKSDLPPGIQRYACDHTDDAETARVFAAIEARSRVAILANCAWNGYSRMIEDGKFTWNAPFWEQPAHRWADMMDAGLRAAWVCSKQIAPGMVQRRSGLIVNLSYWAAAKHLGNAIYGVCKAATDKLSADMAHELRPYGVAALSLYPGLVRTEAVTAAARAGALDISNSESPEFIGRVIAALHADPALMTCSGAVVVAAEAARRLGLVDIDGRSPAPLNAVTA